MAWVRLDDNFPDHPKLQKVGPLGLVAQVKALCYCARFLTDGRIPNAVIVEILRPLKPLTAHQMIAAGLWKRKGQDFLIHDYLQYQPDRSTVLKLRHQRAEFGRRGGIAKAVADANARQFMANNGGMPEPRIPLTPNPLPLEPPKPDLSTIDLAGHEARKQAALELIKSVEERLRKPS